MDNRIESIFDLITASNPETRLRAFRNLLSKAKNGLLDSTIFSYSSRPIESFVTFLDIMVSEDNVNSLNDFNSANYLSLTNFLALIDRFVEFRVVQPNEMNKFAAVVDKLYYLTTISSLPSHLLSEVKKKIEALTSLKVSTTDLLSDIQSDFAAMRSFGAVQVETPSSLPSGSKSHSSTGAGAIFLSRLVFQGFKFPFAMLAQGDEKRLFDLEVNLKLRKGNALKEMRDAVYSYPAPIILQKPSLLQTLFDTLSSPFSELDYEIDPYGFNPIFSLDIIHQLLKNCEKSYHILLEGGLCSHSRFSSLDATDQSVGHAIAKYPVIENDDIIEEKISSSSSIPVPSFSGFAFACCAASLALCQTSHLKLQAVIDPLFRRAVDVLVGVFSLLDVTEAQERELFVARFQHLLDRLAITIASSSEKDMIGSSTISLHFPALWASFQAELTGESSVSYRHLLSQSSHNAVNLSMLSLFLHLQSRMPPSLFASERAQLGKASQSVQLPIELQEVLQKMLLSANSWESLFGTSFFANAQKGMDLPKLRQIAEMRETCQSCYLFTNRNLSEEEAMSLLERPNLELVDFLLENAERSLPFFEGSLNNQQRLESFRSLQSVQFICRLPETIASLYLFVGLLSSHGEEVSWSSISERLMTMVLRLMVCTASVATRDRMIRSLLLSLTATKQTLLEGLSANQTGWCEVENLLRQRTIDILANEDSLEIKENNFIGSLFCPELVICLSWNFLQTASYIEAMTGASRTAEVVDHDGEETDGIDIESHKTLVEDSLLLFDELISRARSSQRECQFDFLPGRSWQGTLSWIYAMTHSSFYLRLSLEYDHIRESLTFLLAKMEEHCSARESSSQTFTILLSWFHDNQTIRATGFLEARKFLLPSIFPGIVFRIPEQSSDDVFNFDPIDASFLALLPLNEPPPLRLTADIEANETPAVLSLKSKISRPGGRKVNKKVTIRPTEGLFSHDDAEKLRQIAYNADLSISMRLSALRQLVDLFKNDALLLRTCSKQWAIETMTLTFQSLEGSLLLPVFLQNNSNNASLHEKELVDMNSLFHAFIPAGSVPKPTMSFCINLLLLAQMISETFADSLFDSMDFSFLSSSSSRSEGVVGLGLLVALILQQREFVSPSPQTKLFLNAATGHRREIVDASSNHLQLSSEGIVFYRKLSYLSLLFIQNYLLASHHWDLTSCSYTRLPSMFLSTNSNSPELRLSRGFLSSFCMKVTILEKDKQLYSIDEEVHTSFSSHSIVEHQVPSEKQMQFIEYKAKDQNDCVIWKHSVEDVKTCLLDFNAPSKLNLRTTIATSLFDLLAHGQDHESLNQSLVVVGLFSQVFPNLDLETVFIEQKISLLPLLSNILTTTPHSRQDQLCLFLVLKFWISYLSHFRDSESRGEIIELISQLTECVSSLLLPNFLAGRKNTIASASDKDHETFSYCLQSAFLELLANVTRFTATEDLMLDLLFLQRKIVHFLFLEKFVTEDSQIVVSLFPDSSKGEKKVLMVHCSSFRYMATTSLINLVSHHRGVALLQAMEQSVLLPGGEKTEERLLTKDRILKVSMKPLFRIVQVCKLLRPSDSFYDSMTVLMSLKLLRAYLSVECRDRYHSRENVAYVDYLSETSLWQFLVRLLYDHRNEVRFLTLEILELLLPYLDRSPIADGSERMQDDQSVFSFSLPPLDQLYFLFNDEKEASILRLKSLKIILFWNYRCSTVQKVSDEGLIMRQSFSCFELSNQRVVEHLRDLLQSAFASKEVPILASISSQHRIDLKPSSQDSAPTRRAKFSPSCLNLMVDCLSLLARICSGSTCESFDVKYQGFLSVLRQHDLFPLLIQLYDRSWQEKLFVDIVLRSISPSFHFSSSSLSSITQFEPHHNYLQHSFLSLKSFQCKLMRLLLQVNSIDQEGSHSNFLEDCLKHSTLIPSLLDALQRTVFRSVPFNVEIHDEDLDFSLLSDSDCLDIRLFSTILSTILSLFDGKDEACPRLALFEQLLCRRCSSALSTVLSSTGHCLLLINRFFSHYFLAKGTRERPREAICLCLNNVFQFLSLSLQSNVVIAESPQEVIVKIFVQLTLFRVQLQSLPDWEAQAETTVLRDRLDVVIAAFLENFVVCRKIFKLILFSDKYRLLQLLPDAKPIPNRLRSHYLEVIDATHLAKGRDSEKKKGTAGKRERVRDENQISNKAVAAVGGREKSRTSTKWREKTRSYVLREKEVPDADKIVALNDYSDNIKSNLFFSLVVLKNSLFEFLSVMSEEEVRAVCHNLSQLFRANLSFALVAGSSSSRVPKDLLGSYRFLPSQSQLFSWIYGNIVVLLRDSVVSCHDQPKQTEVDASASDKVKEYFLKCFEDKPLISIAHSSTPASLPASGFLHQLLSLGTGSGFHPIFRHLSLHLMSFILRTNHIGEHVSFAPAVRISVSHILAIQIQSLLSSPSLGPSSEDLLSYLVLALLSFVGTSNEVTAASSKAVGDSGISCYHTYLCEKHVNLSNYNNLHALQGHSSKLHSNNITKKTLRQLTSFESGSQEVLFQAIDSVKLLPLNDLLVWVHDKLAPDSRVMTTVALFLFRIFQQQFFLSSLPPNSTSSTPPKSGNESSTINDKAIVAMCSSDNVLEILLKLSDCSFPSCAEISRLTLKLIFNSSEKLKTAIKGLLATRRFGDGTY